MGGDERSRRRLVVAVAALAATALLSVGACGGGGKQVIPAPCRHSIENLVDLSRFVTGMQASFAARYGGIWGTAMPAGRRALGVGVVRASGADRRKVASLFFGAAGLNARC